MPFPMTHMAIAYNILQAAPQIKNPKDFMLGAIAPDSVHFRSYFDSDEKKASHLCIGNQKWGQVTNNEEWLDSVLAFLYKNRNAENIDFIYGYCSHVIADIQNNIKIWTPFRMKNEVTVGNGGLGSIYHNESRDMDSILFKLHPKQGMIMKLLEGTKGYDLADMVVGSEIDAMREHLFHRQFKDIEMADVAHNKYVTLEIAEKFIQEESAYINGILFKDRKERQL